VRVPLNLAREPFRRDRPILIASALTGVLLFVSLLILISIAFSERRVARQEQAELIVLNRQLAQTRAEQATLDREMRLPGNGIVLDRSILINTLIRRKAISWTRIFADLATVLPPNVRVVTIRPQVNAREQLSLDMTVAAETPEPVIGFIAKLEGSDVFGAVTPSGITPPTQNDPIYRYRLTVTYAQKL
jgi:type IV pilus assembly protein PilN